MTLGREAGCRQREYMVMHAGYDPSCKDSQKMGAERLEPLILLEPSFMQTAGCVLLACP